MAAMTSFRADNNAATSIPTGRCYRLANETNTQRLPAPGSS